MTHTSLWLETWEFRGRREGLGRVTLISCSASGQSDTRGVWGEEGKKKSFPSLPIINAIQVELTLCWKCVWQFKKG